MCLLGPPDLPSRNQQSGDPVGAASDGQCSFENLGFRVYSLMEAAEEFPRACPSPIGVSKHHGPLYYWESLQNFWMCPTPQLHMGFTLKSLKRVI